MGLRHFGQMGGGVFLAMYAHAGSGESTTELTVTDLPGWGGDQRR